MSKQYKKKEEKRKRRQLDIKFKLVDSFGSLIGENKLLQKSKHKRMSW